MAPTPGPTPPAPLPGGVALSGAGVRSAELPGSPSRTLLHPTTLRLTEPRIALVGANGQGKTTLLRAIAALTPLSEGSVTVGDVDVATQTQRLRSLVGFLFADTAAQLIMPTVAEDIELSLRRLGLPRRRRQDLARDLLAQAGIAHLTERSVYELSGGERQLVALCGISAIRPALLLADEPTAALDLVNSRQVTRALWSLEAQVIFATHDLALARRADRALWIHAGRVVADGDPADVVRRYEDAA